MSITFKENLYWNDILKYTIFTVTVHYSKRTLNFIYLRYTEFHVSYFNTIFSKNKTVPVNVVIHLLATEWNMRYGISLLLRFCGIL